MAIGAAAAMPKGPASGSKPEAPPDRPGPLVLEERPDRFVPKQPRTEAEQDRVEALALFSTARIREQAHDYPAALRLYQRALRCDPEAAPIARAIVPLAAQLGRHMEAIRYALKVAALDDPDPLLLKRLGLYLTETGQWDEALVLYEKAVAARQHAKIAAEDVVLWMEMGRLYDLSGKYEKAAERFARVTEVLDHPDRFGLGEAIKKLILSDAALSYALMGESFLLAGRHAKAAEAFERADRAAPNKGVLGYNLARIDARTGKPDKAQEKLQAYFDARGSTEGLGPYRLLAELLQAANQRDQLLPRLEKLHAADPKNVPLGYFLAEKYLEGKRYEKAEAISRSLVSKAPNAIGFRNLVAVYGKGKRYDELVSVLGEALRHNVSPESLAEKDHPLANDADLVRGLIEAARRRAKDRPKQLPYEARLAVALLAMDARQLDAAEELFELAAADAKPEQAARALLAWGLGLLSQGEYARAARAFQRGVDRKLLAGEPTFLFYLAGALEMSGRTEEALAAARKALEIATAGERPRPAPPAKPEKPPAKLPEKPPSKLPPGKPSEKPSPTKQEIERREAPRILARIAWILYHAKRYDEAEKAYADLICSYEADYGSLEVREVLHEARLVLSNIAVTRGNVPRAVQRLEEVLDEFPDDPSALNDLGYLWAEQGKHLQRAYRMTKKAVEEEPDNAAYRDSLGWALFQLGRTREALVELEKAAAKEADPTVLEHLGDAYRAAAEPAKAKDAWRRAAEAYRKAGEAEKAKKTQEKIGTLR